jgi:hypothetical protein
LSYCYWSNIATDSASINEMKSWMSLLFITSFRNFGLSNSLLVILVSIGSQSRFPVPVVLDTIDFEARVTMNVRMMQEGSHFGYCNQLILSIIMLYN